MKYLEIPIIESVNQLLLHLECNDQSRVQGRLEAYSCKSVGQDKKLYKTIQGSTESSSETISAKTQSYLISTLNSCFPDYDFGSISAEHFKVYSSAPVGTGAGTGTGDVLSIVAASINATLSSVGASLILPRLWEAMNEAIGLIDCQIYSYISDLDSDPFGEEGILWSFNYFFWNKKLKRILFFYCRSMSASESGMDDISSRSSTPFLEISK